MTTTNRKVAVFLMSVLAVLAQSSDEERANSDSREMPLPNRPDDVISPQWVYRCGGESGCQREWRTNSSGVHQSLTTCRLTCGRFGALWPRPATAALSGHVLPLHPDFIRFDLVDAAPETRELLKQMTQVFMDNVRRECGGSARVRSNTTLVVYLNVKSDDLRLDWETDESYSLDLLSKTGDMTAHLTSETVFGTRHGLETLSQLMGPNWSSDPKSPSCQMLILAGAKIRDKPAYPHRGLSLDTARNFIPLEDIRRTIDGMAASKMNVLHWHATDSQSFPLEIPSVPFLSRYGAYSPSAIYRAADVRELLQYARVRGVRVVLEIDAPAHAGNGWQWGKEYGLGELAVCVNKEPWRSYCIQPPCGQLNPANPNLYNVLRELYKDIVRTFPPGELFHMGGDEVFTDCWASVPEIVDFMKAKGLDADKSGFMRIWAEFQETALSIFDEEMLAAHPGYERTPIMVWSSDLTDPLLIEQYLPKDRYVIQSWSRDGERLPETLTALGYRVIASPKDVWYLDHGFWGRTRYSTWRNMYEHRLPAGLLGGEVASWSEYCDGHNLDVRIWPRAAAVAERLWSDPSTTSRAAEARLNRHRERLITRGLQPEAIAPRWCTLNEQRCQ